MKNYLLQFALTSLIATSVEFNQAPALDKWIGTWTLSLEESKLGDMIAFEPGARLLAQKLKIEVTDGKLRVTGSTTLSGGRSFPDEINLLDLDGKQTTLSPGITVSFKPVSEVSFDIIVQINTSQMNAAGLNRFVISRGGRTLTETKTQISREVVPEGTDPTKGKILKSSTSVLVFDKLP